MNWEDTILMIADIVWKVTLYSDNEVYFPSSSHTTGKSIVYIFKTDILRKPQIGFLKVIFFDYDVPARHK